MSVHRFPVTGKHSGSGVEHLSHPLDPAEDQKGETFPWLPTAGPFATLDLVFGKQILRLKSGLWSQPQPVSRTERGVVGRGGRAHACPQSL